MTDKKRPYLTPEEFWRKRLKQARSDGQIAKVMKKLVHLSARYSWARRELKKILGSDDERKCDNDG